MIEQEAAEEMITALNNFVFDVNSCLIQLRKDGQECLDNMENDQFSQKVVSRLENIIQRYERIRDQAGNIRDFLIRKLAALEELEEEFQMEED